MPLPVLIIILHVTIKSHFLQCSSALIILSAIIYRDATDPREVTGLAENEISLREFAGECGVPYMTLYSWLQSRNMKKAGTRKQGYRNIQTWFLDLDKLSQWLLQQRETMSYTHYTKLNKTIDRLLDSA